MSDNSPLLVYLPVMHQSLWPADFPAQALCPGLTGAPSGNAYAVNGPFDPEQAKTCLAQINSFVQDSAGGRPVFTGLAPLKSKKYETESLAYFSRTGLIKPTDAPAEAQNLLREAQWVLLAAWSLEEQVVDIRAAISRYAGQVKQLEQSLGDDTDGEMSGAGQVDGFLQTPIDDGYALLPAWRIILENALPFLPRDCVLVSADAGMTEDLREEVGFSGAKELCPDVLRVWQSNNSAWNIECARLNVKRLLGGSESLKVADRLYDEHTVVLLHQK
jgi:hypothetical protein